MLVHRSPHRRGFTLVSNNAAFDVRLSYNARGLLLAMLAGRSGDVVNCHTLTAAGRTGKALVCRGLRELASYGYYRVEKLHDEETGRVYSVSHVYETPYRPLDSPGPVEGARADAARRAGADGACPDPESPEAAAPGSGIPVLGDPAPTPTVTTTTAEEKGLTSLPGPDSGPDSDADPGDCSGDCSDAATGGHPAIPGQRGRTTRRPQQRPHAHSLPSPPPSPQQLLSVRASLAAAAVLHGITAVDHRLVLGARDRATVAPLIDEWLARGATDGQIISAATQGLPATLRNPAALLTYRLKDKLPPRHDHLPAPPPALAEHPECVACDRPLSSHTPAADGLCGDCRHYVAAASTPEPVPVPA